MIKPLPSYLVTRYAGWHATQFEENKSWYQYLAEVGQHPRAMIISCCDSRVQAMSLFGAESGDFFIHRNIANLIPPYNADGDHHGTSAAIEFAVSALKVAHIIVLGHSSCGGIMGGYHACNGTKKELYEDTVFIKKWLEILKSAYDTIDKSLEENDQVRELEKRSIIVSLQNLMGFPFVAEAIKEDRLTLHGVWHDIASGRLMAFDSELDQFTNVID